MRDLEKENKKLRERLREFEKGARSTKQINSAKQVKQKLEKAATAAELRVCRLLARNLITFEFQYPVYTKGGYIVVDFYLPKFNLAIELDGAQHFAEDSLAADKNRDNFLKKKGIRVLRLSNSKAASLHPEGLKAIITDFIRYRMVSKIRQYQDFEILTFGKYSGLTISEVYRVDKTYLIWLYRSLLARYSDSMTLKLKL